MEKLYNITQEYLSELSDKEYFNWFETRVDRKINLEQLTNFLTVKPYTETKPYLFRRQLIPIDNRFNKVELVYEESLILSAIVWELKISLSQLTNYFGKPIIHNDAYSNSTEFAFRSENPELEIIMTRHPEWLIELNNSIGFEYENDTGSKTHISDPEFNFVQFSLKK